MVSCLTLRELQRQWVWVSRLQGTVAQSELIRSESRDRVGSGDRVSYRDLSLAKMPEAEMPEHLVLVGLTFVDVIARSTSFDVAY
jgi:hypothetical protein